MDTDKKAFGRRQMLWSIVVRRPGVTCLLAALLAAVLLYTMRENDPVYERKPLSEHLQSFEKCGLGLTGLLQPPEPLFQFVGPEHKAAVEAIAHVGPNALPMLVRWLGAKDSKFALWLDSVAQKRPLVRKIIGPKRFSAWSKQMGAVAAFSILGPRAFSAIPKIKPLLNDPESAVPAAYALYYIHPASEADIMSLTNLLSIHTDAKGRSFESFHPAAIIVLSTFGLKAAEAIPVLMQSLNSTNPFVQSAAAVALVRAGAPPDRVVPTVIQSLSAIKLPSTTRPTRFSIEEFKTLVGPVFINPPPPMTPPTGSLMGTPVTPLTDMMPTLQNLWVLGEYGEKASDALSAIARLYNYPLDNVRRSAIETAEKIRGWKPPVF